MFLVKFIMRHCVIKKITIIILRCCFCVTPEAVYSVHIDNTCLEFVIVKYQGPICLCYIV